MGRAFPVTAAVAGPVGVALLAIALLLPGAPVRTDQPASEIANILANRHVAFALSNLVAGIALLALCLFAGALYRFLAAAHCGVAGFGAAAAIVSGVVLTVVGMSAFSGLALEPLSSTPTQLVVVRAAVDTGNVIIGLAMFPFAGLIICVVAGAPDILGRRMRLTGAVATVALLTSAFPPALATNGVGQFGGLLDVAGFGIALLWMFAFSVVVAARACSDGRVPSTIG